MKKSVATRDAQLPRRKCAVYRFEAYTSRRGFDYRDTQRNTLNVLKPKESQEPVTESQSRRSTDRDLSFWKRAPRWVLALVGSLAIAYALFKVGQVTALRDREQARLEDALKGSQSASVAHIAQGLSELQGKMGRIERELDQVRDDHYRDTSALNNEIKSMTKAMQDLTIEIRSMKK